MAPAFLFSEFTFPLWLSKNCKFAIIFQFWPNRINELQSTILFAGFSRVSVQVFTPKK